MSGRGKGAVRLPSDNMTGAERKKLNGEIKSYSLKKPMRWDEFRKLPPELKKVHIDFLVKEFDLRAPQIAQYFYIAKHTAIDMMKLIGSNQPRGRRTWTEEAQERFREWRKGGVM